MEVPGTSKSTLKSKCFPVTVNVPLELFEVSGTLLFPFVFLGRLLVGGRRW